MHSRPNSEASATPLVRVEYRGAVALILVDNPPVNTITRDVRAGLRQALAQIAQGPAASAILLTCAGTTFFSGADIGEFSGPPRELEYRDLLHEFEQQTIPVVAAMFGTVLGGGLEIALACHHRIALASARFGLPEVTLGIFPGAGGTQRMPRLIGVERTLELLLSGKPVDARRARELGFIDEIVDDPLETRAIAFAETLVREGRAPRRTRDLPVTAATPEVLDRSRTEARRLYPNRTAALRAIDVVEAASRLPFEAGLEYETEQVNLAKQTAESRALVHVFFAERECRKVPGLEAEPPGRGPSRAAVVGAGTMGAGISICFANAGIPVSLIDVSPEAVERGLGSIRKTLDGMVSRGRLTPDERDQRFTLVSGSSDYAAARDADIAVEAVYEDLGLKERVFRALDEVMAPGAILATNTSTLDIRRIAAATSRPADVLGLHFFSPANVMPLLEVVRTPETSAGTLRSALELGRRLRKTTVVANLCYGFIGNRMMEGYAREAERLVLEGETPRRVDSVLEQWGMAMGILAVFDMAGIDVGVKVHRANADQYPPDPTYYQADMALHAAGRLGQKSGAGYYRYESGSRARLDDPEAIAILRAAAERLDVSPRSHSDEEILERCLYPLMNEGFRLLEEGIALRPGDIDVVWTSGYGFPRYRGGPLFFAESLGLDKLYDGMCRYRDEHGPMHWQPAPLLEQLVRDGRSLAEWRSGTLRRKLG